MRSAARGFLAVAVLAVVPEMAAAQGVIDWPVRTTVRPAAVAAVPTAALWNPAAAQPHGRAELLALDADVPTGLRVLGVAGAATVTERLTLSAAYQHQRIDDIERTTNTPAPDPNGALDVSEHLLALAGAWTLQPALVLGGVVRISRLGDALGNDMSAGAGVGAVYTPALRFAPRFGAALFGAPDGIEWTVGAEVLRPVDPAAELVLTAGIGANAGPGPGIAQRAVGGVIWRDQATLHVALVGEPESDRTTWQPAVDASIRISRYGLGLVHERLAQGFGGVNTFRLSISF